MLLLDTFTTTAADAPDELKAVQWNTEDFSTWQQSVTKTQQEASLQPHVNIEKQYCWAFYCFYIEGKHFVPTGTLIMSSWLEEVSKRSACGTQTQIYWAIFMGIHNQAQKYNNILGFLQRQTIHADTIILHLANSLKKKTVWEFECSSLRYLLTRKSYECAWVSAAVLSLPSL